MTLNDFIAELDLTIKQGEHDICCTADIARMIKEILKNAEKETDDLK